MIGKRELTDIVGTEGLHSVRWGFPQFFQPAKIKVYFYPAPSGSCLLLKPSPLIWFAQVPFGRDWPLGPLTRRQSFLQALTRLVKLRKRFSSLREAALAETVNHVVLFWSANWLACLRWKRDTDGRTEKGPRWCYTGFELGPLPHQQSSGVRFNRRCSSLRVKCTQ